MEGKQPSCIALTGSPLKAGSSQHRGESPSQPTTRCFSKLFLNGGPYCYCKISQEQAAGSTWIPPIPTGPRLLAIDLEGGPHGSPYTEGKRENTAPLEMRLNILCLKALPPFRLQNALVNRQNLSSA